MNGPFSEVVRLNEIGEGLTRTLIPSDQVRTRIATALDLAALDRFQAEVSVVPSRMGWTLSGRVAADAVQTCGVTLDPLPVVIDKTFSIELAERVGSEPDDIVEISMDDDAPDTIEDGRIDLGHYAVEQLALSLDPFPRKPGAEFVQPPEPTEISPFAVLTAFRAKSGDDRG